MRVEVEVEGNFRKTFLFMPTTKQENAFKSVFEKISDYTMMKVPEGDLY